MVMGSQNVSPYQQVIEKTKNLIYRSQALAGNIDKREQSKNTSSSKGQGVSSYYSMADTWKLYHA